MNIVPLYSLKNNCSITTYIPTTGVADLQAPLNNMLRSFNDEKNISQPYIYIYIYI